MSTARVVREQIRRVSAALRAHWDPIGGGRMPDLPDDEYESYAPRVVALFREGADDRKVATYLSEVERVAMGIDPAPPDALLPTVRLVRTAWSSGDHAG